MADSPPPANRGRYKTEFIPGLAPLFEFFRLLLVHAKIRTPDVNSADQLRHESGDAFDFQLRNRFFPFQDYFPEKLGFGRVLRVGEYLVKGVQEEFVLDAEFSGLRIDFNQHLLQGFDLGPEPGLDKRRGVAVKIAAGA